MGCVCSWLKCWYAEKLICWACYWLVLLQVLYFLTGLTRIEISRPCLLRFQASPLHSVSFHPFATESTLAPERHKADLSFSILVVNHRPLSSSSIVSLFPLARSIQFNNHEVSQIWQRLPCLSCTTLSVYTTLFVDHTTTVKGSIHSHNPNWKVQQCASLGKWWHGYRCT